MKPKVYLGGPMPQPSLGAQWRGDVREELKQNYCIVDPLDSQSLSEDWDFRSAVMTDQDLHAIRGCDIVIFNFAEIQLGEYPSIGSFCELGYAYANEKLIYVVSGGEEWIAFHPFVRRMPAYVFDNIHDLIFHLNMKADFFMSISS